MIHPTKYPQATTSYNDFWDFFKTDKSLRDMLTSNWSTSTYEGAGDPANIAKLNLLPEFKITDSRLTWFTWFTDKDHLAKVDALVGELLKNNNIASSIENIGVAGITLVPGAHLQEHVDAGNYAGTALIMPILGYGEFTYMNGTKRFKIDKPTFASNTVWHNYKNTSDSLHIFFTVSLPIDIREIIDSNLVSCVECNYD